MAKGYWVARVDVTDPEQFKKYSAFVGPFVAANSGRFLVRGGKQVVREGEARARTVIVEFASMDAAEAAYDSASYQDGIELRRHAVIVDLVIVEGHGDYAVASMSVSLRNIPDTQAAVGWAGSHTVVIDRPDGKAGGAGLGFNGGQMIALAIGGCFCNDL